MLRSVMHGHCGTPYACICLHAARALCLRGGRLAATAPTDGSVHLRQRWQSAAALSASHLNPDGSSMSRISACHAAPAQSAADAVSKKPFKLIIYSRDDCSLCESLKDKVRAVLERSQFSQSPLSSAALEIRDISSNAAWEARYSLQIPVLTASDADDSHERLIPRPPPRITADRLEKHILTALGGEGTSVN